MPVIYLDTKSSSVLKFIETLEANEKVIRVGASPSLNSEESAGIIQNDCVLLARSNVEGIITLEEIFVNEDGKGNCSGEIDLTLEDIKSLYNKFLP